MGGKNTAVVLASANLVRAADDVAQAAFVMSGQRCTATSRVVVDHSVADEFSDLLAGRVRELTIGDPVEDVDLGPLATPSARASYDRWQGIHDGIETLVEAVLPLGLPEGCWAGPSLHRVSDRRAARDRDQTELFGPEVLVHVARDREDSLALANGTPYGLAISVHCEKEAEFEEIRPLLEAGLVNWNRGTAGASSLMPFGGIKQSGNHRAAGAAAIEYTTHPVSVLRG
jgi:acyl-CoA reductase-like NAD-dependent aldehyde dehydrogenase